VSSPVAERRAIQLSEDEAVPRLSDLYAALPAITGKIELEYEGELVGAASIARELIRRAAEATFRARAGGANTDEPVMWFDEGGALLVADDVDTASMYEAFETVPGLVTLVHHRGTREESRPGNGRRRLRAGARALVARRKISRSDAGQYGRAHPEPRRRPEDHFGGGLSA
jgi:magnesium chelatase subunit I